MVSLLSLAVVAGLAAVERKGFLQAMISRPVALGPIAGLAMGDAWTGLLVGAPLELFWLGAINMGASLPVQEALGTAAITGGAVLGVGILRGLGLSGAALAPAAALCALVACAPLALLGRAAERLVERFNERLYARAERDLTLGELGAAARVNLYGVVLPFAISFVLAPAGAGVACGLVRVAGSWPAVVPLLAAGWLAFSAFACAAGARSLRAERASSYYIAALGFGLALVAAITLGRAAL